MKSLDKTPAFELTTMEPEGSNADLLDSVRIPESEMDLYNQACEDDRIAAKSLSIASNRTSATLLVQGHGREMIARIEKLYSVSSPMILIIFPHLLTTSRAANYEESASWNTEG